ncbi:MAG TPA: hypothetical protein ENK72_00015 [Epsilonproteobacteria bacterium]|nr:hypothetical protein [Campylobacterota bacterium]
MEKLTDKSDDEVIAYFRFENLSVAEPDFCLLFQTKTKCHEMEGLNCYLCGCPHFRFDDDGMTTETGKTRYSTCNIEAKEGGIFETEEAIHQDCTGCLLPHRESVIKKHFSRNWAEIMQSVY